MALPKFIQTAFFKAFLGKLAGDHDTKTTILGVIAGGIVASQLDYGKILAVDPGEIGKAVGAVVAILLGYYTNKPSPVVPTSQPQAPEK